MELNSLPLNISSKLEVAKGSYTNCWLGWKKENGYPDSVQVTKELYEFVNEKDTVIFAVDWYYSKKDNKYKTYVSDIAKEFGKDGFLYCKKDKERIKAISK